MADFVHLHLHSQYSLLDGANRIGDLMEAAKSQGMPAMALTDHGNMFGSIGFYEQAREAGIRPILGMEAYVSQGSMLDRDPARAGNNHLVLLCRNETGYRNLLKLTTRSFLEGFYYKPRIDKELLRRHAEGLICLSACLKGELCERIMQRQEEEAQRTALEFREIFGEENFFLELMDHGIEAQRQVNDILRGIARRHDIPLVATNDCHYLRRGDAFAHDVLLCIGTQKVLADTDRLRYASQEFYLKSGAEMADVFSSDPAAIENTLRIAERCNLEIPTGEFHLPEFPVPSGYTLDSYFAKVAREGLEERLEQLAKRSGDGLRFPVDVYRERLEKEIEIIIRMGFPGYFLVVWDFVRYAREEGIPVGPGRGSAAGSLVSYALRITDIDPLEYDLLFERFLNPERISMPDIDIDFCMRRRGEVIQYVGEKYGRDKVAQIITFGTLAAKAVLRDVGRVMGIPYAKVDRIAKLVPDMTRSLSEAAREVDRFREEVAGDPEVSRIVEVGERLEGLTRHASLHAAGVVITPQPTEELVPLYKTSKDEIVTQWDKDVVERLGLLKMDFLGLRTLTVIDDTLKSLRHQGIELDLDEVPLDDEDTYCLFRDGRTSGIFQFESAGMKDLLRRAQPSKFEDLAAFNALYRPGALSVGMVDEFIKRKKGQKRVSYTIPETRPILEETYGVIAYQEQVMQIAVEIAGFTLGEADVLRKAMGKKKADVMAEQKEKFVSGGVARGFAKKKMSALWDYIEPFAGYGFNKSHSVAYAMLAYKTAFLKAHYPVAFMAAMLTSEMSSADNVAKYVRECREMEIELLRPDVNDSDWAFTPEGEAIRFGLGAIKGIGDAAVEAILKARHRVGRFRSLTHFACEVDLKHVNHKVFECLIKAGCFDSLEPVRGRLFAALDRILDHAQNRQREREVGQGSLFGGGELQEPAPDPNTPDWPTTDLLRYERETLGFYLTGNPLSEYGDGLRRLATHTTADLRHECEGKIKIGGLVTRLRQIKIKSGPNAGRLMGRFVLEDLDGTIAATLFADVMQRYGGLLEDYVAVVVTGSLNERSAEPELRIETVELLDEKAVPGPPSVDLLLDPAIPLQTILELRDLLMEHPGKTEVRFQVELPSHTVRVVTGERYRVQCDDELRAAVVQLLGEGRMLDDASSPC